MSAKLIYSIADENPAVQKQIGCMNGIFQLFDRHNFLSSRRISRDHDKRFPDGQGLKDNAETQKEAKETTQKAPAVKSPQVATEKSRTSTDSSTSSISNPGNSTSFSSLDNTRSMKSERVERSSSSQNRSAKVLIDQDSPLLRLHGLDPSWKQSLDTHRDARGITVKSGNREKSSTLTYIDSPRPLQKPNKPAKPRFSSLQESLGVLPNFRKHRPSVDSIEHSRRDSPRLSYDGRETRDAFKSSSRLKELQPRHSLDSKRGSMMGSSQIHRNDLTMDSPRDLGSHRRQSSVVAKLMGLEGLPSSMSEPEVLEMPRSPRITYATLDSHQRDNISQRANNHAVFPKKSNPASRFPIEPAPWKKPEGAQSFEAPQTSVRSIYGEIEKRLSQLEFKKSGKDLRALKQILEAMQKSKEKLDTPKEVEKSNTSLQTFYESRGPKQRLNVAAASPRNIICESPNSPTARRTTSPKASSSSIVVIKPATRKVSNDGPTKAEERIPRYVSDRSISTRRSLACRDTTKEAASPRMQKKKIDPLDCSPRRTSQPGRQKRRPGSQDRNQKSRTNSLDLDGYDQGSEISADSISRDLSDINNSVSLRSESNISLSSWEEPEVSSTYRGESWTRKKASSPLRDGMPIQKPQMNAAEQPSPISVLDMTLYEDESPSPVKMISDAFEGINSYGSQWDQEDVKGSSFSKETSFSSEISHIGLTKMLPFRHSMAINSTNPDHRYIMEILSASGLLRERDYRSINFQLNQPDHLFTRKLFLALEQMKASGNKLSNGTQEIPQLKSTDKLRRRLVFDVVNEILVKKYSCNHSKNWLGKRKDNQIQLLHGLCSEIDQLQAISSSISSSDEEGDNSRHIIEKDLNNQSVIWADGFADISGAVLDIERLIFKDLVTELVDGAAALMLRARNLSANYCRQLF
ncbi:hypothetical protein SAY87_024190 [Trapa incisa]|uniref:DUF4378 domain-containing protein n=1 Tax=Trapa incisa TaxID=236973 RepID=A0AAN7L1W4_9MYRT|nr:hypothetical protein SAY87_024190 [Trapa incisa]